MPIFSTAIPQVEALMRFGYLIKCNGMVDWRDFATHQSVAIYCFEALCLLCALPITCASRGATERSDCIGTILGLDTSCNMTLISSDFSVSRHLQTACFSFWDCGVMFVLFLWFHSLVCQASASYWICFDDYDISPETSVSDFCTEVLQTDLLKWTGIQFAEHSSAHKLVMFLHPAPDH